MPGANGAPLSEEARNAAQALLDRIGTRPKIAMLLGTGHSSITGQLNKRHVVAHDDLPTGMTFSGQAPLLSGALEGCPVVVSDPPLALYEGHSPAAVMFPIHVLRAMGAEVLIMTAGGASIDLQLEPGTIALVEDHINLSGAHPLQGPPDERSGPRFPDMSDPYSAGLRAMARRVAIAAGVPCLQAVFAGVPGPGLPTRAEYRFYRRIGADVVGMSLVPEVHAAVHAGFAVLALVGITQMVNTDAHRPASIEDLLDAADLAAPRMATMIAGVVRELAK